MASNPTSTAPATGTPADASPSQTDRDRDTARRATAPDMPAGAKAGPLDTLGQAISDTVGGSLPQTLPPGTRTGEEADASDDDAADAPAAPRR